MVLNIDVVKFDVYDQERISERELLPRLRKWMEIVHVISVS